MTDWRIVLEQDERRVEIETCTETADIHDLAQLVVEPALKALGFSDQTVGRMYHEGLKEYADVINED